MLNGFVLIGGTALMLHIGHRVSEDLDFAFTEKHLPRVRLQALARDLDRLGVSLAPNPSPLDEEDFMNSGLELANYQQNYIANDAVKISFVVLAPPAYRVLQGAPSVPLRVATLNEIFATKALLCAERSTTRDWFDLYVLLTQHGFTMDDFYAVYERLSVLNLYEIAAMHLRACRPDPADEGYERLLSDAPSLDSMRAFFREQLGELEVRVATRAFSEKGE
jgi:hypothetical protein